MANFAYSTALNYLASLPYQLESYAMGGPSPFQNYHTMTNHTLNFHTPSFIRQDLYTQSSFAMNTTCEVAALAYGGYGLAKAGYKTATALSAKTLTRPLCQTPKMINKSVRQSSAYNRAYFENYKQNLRSNMQKPYVENPELQKIMNRSYRPNAQTGSGSTAAAIRYELLKNQPIKGSWHSQKGSETIKNIENWQKCYPNGKLGDRAAAENVILDLKNALGE